MILVVMAAAVAAEMVKDFLLAQMDLQNILIVLIHVSMILNVLVDA